MRLREFFSIQEDEDEPSSGVPEPIDDDGLEQAPQAGEGPTSDGVPNAVIPSPAPPRRNPPGTPVKTLLKPRSALKGPPTMRMMNYQPPAGARFGEPKPSPRRPVSDPSTSSDPQGTHTQRQSAPTRRIPMGAPPEAERSIHPWAANTDDQPLPDLPIEGLSEFFDIQEMPRPKGAIGPALRAVIDWAAKRGERPFTTQDIFMVYRHAGGRSNYSSFQTSIRNITAPSADEADAAHPLIRLKKGTPSFGGQDNSSVFVYAGSEEGWHYSQGTGQPSVQMSRKADKWKAKASFDDPIGDDDTDRYSSEPSNDDYKQLLGLDDEEGEGGEDDAYNQMFGGGDEDEEGGEPGYSPGEEESEEDTEPSATAPSVFRRRR